MIIYKDSIEELYEQIEIEIHELKQYKTAYQQKLSIYLKSAKNINEMIIADYEAQDIEYLHSLNDRIYNSIKVFYKQIEKINKTISLLYILKRESNIDELKINIENYNLEYKTIKDNFIEDSIYEESVILDYIATPVKIIEKDKDIKEEKIEKKNTIENNSTLLISEIQNKVILPYTGDEVGKIIKSEENCYQTEQEVIDNIFTRKLEDFKDLHAARFNEAYELATKKENYSKIDGIKLGLELFGERYLHPAIIAACRNTDELDVYIDCLHKNELNEFKIFDIKYELYPMVIKTKDNNLFEKINLWKKVSNFIKKTYSKGSYKNEEEK